KQLGGLILSAPMFEIQLGLFSKKFAQNLAQVLVWIGFGKFPGPSRNLNQPLTSSLDRQKMIDETTARFSCINPMKVTFKWILESLKVLDRIQSDAPRISCPVLLFQAAKDLIVAPGGQDLFLK